MDNYYRNYDFDVYSHNDKCHMTVVDPECIYTYAQDKWLQSTTPRNQNVTPVVTETRKYVPPHARKNSHAAHRELPERSCESPPRKPVKFPSEKKLARLRKYGKKPDLTPSAIRASLRRKYEKDPQKFQKIFFSVFPKPVNTNRYEDEISKLSCFADPMTKNRINALLLKIRTLRERHARRLQKSDQIVLDYIRKRIERWELLHQKPYAAEGSLEDDNVSYMSISTCSTSTQTDSEISFSDDSETDTSDLEAEENHSVSVSVQTDAVQDPLVQQLERQINILTLDKEQLEKQIDFHVEMAVGNLEDRTKKKKTFLSVFKKK
jgi:hypothetical protein